jgi:hypothetical protein
MLDLSQYKPEEIHAAAHFSIVGSPQQWVLDAVKLGLDTKINTDSVTTVHAKLNKAVADVNSVTRIRVMNAICDHVEGRGVIH